MGLIVPQTVKIRTSGLNCKHFREKGYEFKKCGDFIEVDVLDLHPGSTAKVKVICDICGKESEMWYRTVVKCNEKNELITCGSNSCRNKKYEDTCMKKYGVKSTNQLKTVKDKKINTCRKNYGENITNPFQAEEVKEKIKQTNLEHHGCEYPTQNEEIRNKGIQTLKGKYGEDIVNVSQVKEIQDKKKKTWKENHGEDVTSPFQLESVKEKIKAICREHLGVDYPLQSNEIQDKIKATWQKNYGEDIINPFQVESVKEKSKQTMLKNHGVEHALQNREILNKMLDSFQFNGTGPCSRAQKYIHFLIGGTLNKRVCNSLVDICFEEEKTAIEYDGGGHFLGELIVNKDRSISKEAILREKNREDSIVNKGYKVIRFIAAKDRIPSDEVILNLVEGFKNSDFKVIRINFEEGTIDRDYEEKWYCNFGKLRKITKEDLEQFESKKQ